MLVKIFGKHREIAINSPGSTDSKELFATLTGTLISPQPKQEGNKLMFLSEWREFPSASCLAEKKRKKKT